VAENIGLAQMIAAYTLLLIVFAAAMSNRLQINKELIVATLRMTVQLLVAGFILKYLFQLNYWYTSAALLVLMLASAVHVVLGRIKLRVARLSSILFVSMGAGSVFVISVFMFLIVQRYPWYDARYLIPIGGMIIGNAMTACVLVVERFASEVRNNRHIIETNLALGATSKEASIVSFRAAYKAALMPNIASMMGIGLVHLPGMMTGQIISGVEPLLAVRYQIAIILAILSSAALSGLIALYLVRRQLFNRFHQIVLPE
jgi:putative ABC transport system permease protein